MSDSESCFDMSENVEYSAVNSSDVVNSSSSSIDMVNSCSFVFDSPSSVSDGRIIIYYCISLFNIIVLLYYSIFSYPFKLKYINKIWRVAWRACDELKYWECHHLIIILVNFVFSK